MKYLIEIFVEYKTNNGMTESLNALDREYEHYTIADTEKMARWIDIYFGEMSVDELYEKIEEVLTECVPKDDIVFGYVDIMQYVGDIVWKEEQKT